MKRLQAVRRLLATYAFVIPFCALLGFPFAVMFTSALKSDLDIFVPVEEFRWWPEQPEWGNLRLVWQEVPLLARSFGNSAVIATGATLLALFAALPAAYALARTRFAGRRVFMQAVLVTQMFSPIVIVVGVYKLFAGADVSWFWRGMQGLGLGVGVPQSAPTTLDDSLLGLVLVNGALNLAFAIWMLTSYFATVPRETEEAALVDGCTPWQSVWHVLMPLAAPGIVTAGVFVFIASWNEFLFALTLLRTPEKKPVVVALFSLIGMFEVRWNLVMAGALMAVVPVVVLFWLVERHLVSGLTAGAVK